VASLAATESDDTLITKLLRFVSTYIIHFRIFLCWTLLLNNKEIVIMMTTIIMIAIEEEGEAH
jgi:hypothetical protein